MLALVALFVCALLGVVTSDNSHQTCTPTAVVQEGGRIRQLLSLPTSTLVLASILILMLFFRVRSCIRVLRSHPRGMIAGLVQALVGAVKVVPGLNNALDAKAEEFLAKAIHKYAGSEVSENPLNEMPRRGLPAEDLKQKLKHYLYDFGDPSWRTAQCSGACYMRDDEVHEELCHHAITLYSDSNALHFDCFPAITKFEREIIRMTKGILSAKGNDDVAGLVSTGGTESILLSVLSHREYGLKTKGITNPNIICPTSIHPAFDKGCHIFGLEVRKASCDQTTFKVKVDEIVSLIDENTVLIAASAPCYPHGIIDPIEEIAAIAKERNIPFHVDCCLGGFYLPFLRMVQQRQEGGVVTVPPFDFAVEGVTAMSADTHKFGMAPKGSSVILFRGKERRDCAFYHNFDWTGGHYATGTLLGSRSGGAIAAAWSSLNHVGLEGFIEITAMIQKQVRIVMDRIETLDGLEVLGDPIAMLIAMNTSRSDISPYQMLDEMKARGWKLQGLQMPPAFHMMFNAKHIDENAGTQFADDLEEAWKAVIANPQAHKEGSAALYGTALVAPIDVLGKVAVGVLGYTLDGRPTGQEQEEEEGEIEEVEEVDF